MAGVGSTCLEGTAIHNATCTPLTSATGTDGTLERTVNLDGGTAHVDHYTGRVEITVRLGKNRFTDSSSPPARHLTWGTRSPSPAAATARRPSLTCSASLTTSGWKRPSCCA